MDSLAAPVGVQEYLSDSDPARNHKSCLPVFPCVPLDLSALGHMSWAVTVTSLA